MTTLYVRDLFGDYAPAQPELIIAEAKRRIAVKFRRGISMTSPNAAREAIQLKIAEYEHEVFLCVLLDLCAAIKNVKSAGKAPIYRPASADLLHINFFKVVVASR